jgi:hypothetical protein
MPADTLTLRPDVRWRSYPDGVALFVPQTCEAHLLPLDFLGLLESPSQVQIVAEEDVIEPIAGPVAGEMATRVSRRFVDELVQLKIFEPLN